MTSSNRASADHQFVLQGQSCPSCGSRSFIQFGVNAFDDTGTISINRCFQCDLAWQWPKARGLSETITYFDQRYQAAGTDNRRYFEPQRRGQVAKLAMDFVQNAAPAARTLLDVGAGDGALIKEAERRGLQAVGIEPSTEACRRFQPQSGSAEMIHGTLDSVRPEAKFDVITLMDVIEHLDDPLAALQRVKHNLKTNGALIIETGNFLSIERVVAAEAWWCYQWDHRWYFAPPTLARLLKSAGFEPCQLAPRVLRPEWNQRPHYRGPSRILLLKEAVRQPLSAARVWRRYRDLKCCADEWAEWSRLNIFAMAARHAEACG